MMSGTNIAVIHSFRNLFISGPFCGRVF